MHLSARENAIAFVGKYVAKGSRVLDVGSQDVNGTLKDLFVDCEYVGMDLEEGPNVDVIFDGKKFPFEDAAFDVIISTSCFEHDGTFWITFAEMVRVLKPSGLIYINAPSSGQYHGYPVDCYRFYPDAWKALADWQGIELLEQYIDASGTCEWNDNVGVFQKP